MQEFIKLDAECKFYPYDGGHTQGAFIIRTPEGRQFKISSLAKSILEQLDGKTDIHQVAHNLDAGSASVSEEQLRKLIETKYTPMGIFEHTRSQDDAARPAGQTGKPRSPFLLYWNLIPQKYVGLISARLTFFYHSLFVTPALLLIIGAHLLVYLRFTNPDFLSQANFLNVLFLCLFSILAHEFGHAAAVSRYGGNPGSIGFALYLLMPSFYADVSEIWRFPRKQRMVVDIGGVYFQQVVFAIFALAGFFTSAPEYFIACHLIDLMTLLTLNPIFQFDGYWLLVDYMALPKLYQLALNFLKYSIKNIFARTKETIILPPMRRHVYVTFLFYAILCNVFMIAVIWLSSRYLYSTFTKFPIIFTELFRSMTFAIKTQDFTLFINRLLTLFFVVAFPGTALIGLSRYLLRLFKYGATKIQASAAFRNL
jgi:putative peptide zinc metalloprotease protein